MGAGRDALAVLLAHPRMDVRVAAAACLLRHRTQEAQRILEQAAAGKGLAAFEAQQVLKNEELAERHVGIGSCRFIGPARQVASR